MKRTLTIIVFVVAIVLGLAVVNGFGQDCFQCCPLGQSVVNVRGRLIGDDAYTQSLIRSRRVTGVFVYEYRQNLTKFLPFNINGYYSTNVDACEIIIIQPYLHPRYEETHFLLSSPTNIFRDLYFEPEFDGVVEQDFNILIQPF